MKITVLPSADAEEMLGQFGTDWPWDAKAIILHEGNEKCSGVEAMSSCKGSRSTETPGVHCKLVIKQNARAAVQEKVTW